MGKNNKIIITILSVITIIFLNGLVSSKAFAMQYNEIGGIIDKDIILTIENSPYIVKESITISKGVNLTINEGVELKFKGNTYFEVYGKLKILGSDSAHVVFSSLNEENWDSLIINSKNNEIKFLDLINAKEPLKINEDINQIYNVKAINCNYDIDLYPKINKIISSKKATYSSIAAKYDINSDGKIDILDISSLAVSYNNKNDDESYNKNCDLNLDGIIDIYDMVSLSKHIGSNDTKLYGHTIFVDPGHGGDEPGAVHYGYVEKDINLTLAEKLKDELLKYGAEVIMTRNSDVTMELSERIEMANSANADLFLSVHYDGCYDSSVTGMSTHYSTYRPAVETIDAYALYKDVKCPFISEVDGYATIIYQGVQKKLCFKYDDFIVYDPTPCSSAKASKALGTEIVDSMCSLGFKNRGIRDHNLYVTRWASMPSILIEAGFISNEAEANKVTAPEMQLKIAKKISESVVGYFQ